MTINYGAWHHKTTHFYEDDGGGSSSSKHLLDSDTDLDALRARCNAHFQGLARNYSDRPPQFAEGAMKSSSWSHSGGGCWATGYIAFEELPRL